MYKFIYDPRFIEEPTAPDDIIGHAAIRKALKPHGIGVATGEHAHNRMVFKQLLQADAIDVCQIDSCRLAGVSEVLSVLLMAAKFGVVVCPHAGGVGLCEYVIHLRCVLGQRALSVSFFFSSDRSSADITKWKLDRLHRYIGDDGEECVGIR